MSRVACMILAALALQGCSAQFFMTQIVATPNHGAVLDLSPAANERQCREMGADRFIRVRVGTPRISLGSWIFEPPTQPARGTVLVLHGVADGPFWMRDKARALAKHGYRAVLVGLRGYGASTGEFRGYGVLERDDLTQLVDELERRGLVEGSLGVWGMSYGGAVAIMYAAQDARVRAVVTVGAFASMRSAVPHAMKLFFPLPSLLQSDEEQQALIDMAAEFAGIDPDAARAEVAIRTMRTPVLLLHGDWDWIVPYEQAERLHAAAADHSELVRLTATGHFGSYMDLGGAVEKATLGWFDRYLTAPTPAAPGGAESSP